MLPIIVIILILVFIGGIILLLKKKNNSCSCLGKVCKTDNDCLGSTCCDTNTCQNGKCCSTDCTGKSCSQSNSCGQSCSKYICGVGEVCFEGNCCQPECAPNTCGGDGCGGQCSCEPGYTCITDSQGIKTCCKPPDCSSGFCGTTPCGSCSCMNDYCESSVGCCVSGNCKYKDICKANSNFGKILGNSWAKFCDTCSSPLDHCELVQPQFYPGSFIPKSGILRCSSCKDNNVPDVEIDQDAPASYYDYDISQNKIVPSFIGNYCKDSLGKCDGSCVCLTDQDCAVYGCVTCLGGRCQ